MHGGALYLKLSPVERFFTKDDSSFNFVSINAVDSEGFGLEFSDKHLVFSSSPPSLPKRDSKGRFMARKWVAYFTYPDSRYGYDVARELVTDYEGDTHPYFDAGDVGRNGMTVEGYDRSRDAYRKFLVDRMTSHITWKKEYVERQD